MNTIDLTGERQKRIYQMYDGHHCPSWLLIGVIGVTRLGGEEKVGEEKVTATKFDEDG